MIETVFWLVFISFLIYIVLKIKIMTDIFKEIEAIEKIMNKEYEIIYNSLKNLIGMKLDIETIKKRISSISQITEEAEEKNRKHNSIAKVSYSNPLETYKGYEQYKDKKSGLYEPRRPSRGLKIEEGKEAE